MAFWTSIFPPLNNILWFFCIDKISCIVSLNTGIAITMLSVLSLLKIFTSEWRGGGRRGCFKKWLIDCANCSLESKSAVKTLLFIVNEPNWLLKCRRFSSLALALHDFKVKKRLSVVVHVVAYHKINICY